MHRRQAVQLLAGASIGGGRIFAATPLSGQNQQEEDHLKWVTEILTRMQTITSGVTRETLMKVFNTEGGLYNRLQRTFVSRDCPYFKVDVAFKPDRDENGIVSKDVDKEDIVLTISRPYLEFTIAD